MEAHGLSEVVACAQGMGAFMLLVPSQIRMQQDSAALNRQAWPTFLARVRNLCLRVQSGRDLLMMVTPCTEIIYEIGGQLMGYPLRVRWVCSFQVIARLQGFSQRLCRAYGCEV